MYRSWRRLRASWRDTLILLREFRLPLLSSLQASLAGRYDTHENYDAQFSPKAGIVVRQKARSPAFCSAGQSAQAAGVNSSRSKPDTVSRRAAT